MTTDDANSDDATATPDAAASVPAPGARPAVRAADESPALPDEPRTVHRGRGGMLPMLVAIAFGLVGIGLAARAVIVWNVTADIREVAARLARIHRISPAIPHTQWPAPALIAEACASGGKQLDSLSDETLGPRLLAIVRESRPALEKLADKYPRSHPMLAVHPGAPDLLIDASLWHTKRLAHECGTAGRMEAFIMASTALGFMLVAFGAIWWRRSARRIGAGLAASVMVNAWCGGTAILLGLFGI